MRRACSLALCLGLAFLGCEGPKAPESSDRGARSVLRTTDDQSPPNVLLIVVDTLRADRLSFYGHVRDTSPEMKRLIADRGVVMEQAYAQAPWTLPSVASMMTGLDPARFLDENGHPWGLPEGAVTLAEVLSEAGYDTRAFVANPTLHEGNGFAQGFEHFETAPYDVASLRLHADSLDARIQPQLESLQEPFFLYAHYLDPHDPYENPELEDGKSPFFPEYTGRLRGTDVHGLYLRKLAMEDPEQDVKHLKALYDSEIRYVDRYIGEMLGALPEETVAETLVVLSSDHGEELYDHGGWKHGESVYQEQIRVPLVFRWDGRLPAGRRVESTVRLLDVMPTVLDATGLLSPELAESLEGRSLLPMLEGERGEELPAFSRHHAEGPVRIARIESRRKTILFDREAEFQAETERQSIFLELGRERMQRLEVYDLASDPAETSKLAGDGAVHFGGKEVWEGIDPYVDGLRIFVSGLEGGRVRGRIQLERPPEKIQRWFMGPEDRVQLHDREVTFDWLGDGVDKGISIEGALGSVRDFHVEAGELEMSILWAGSKGEVTMPLGLRRLLTDRPPMLEVDGPSVSLWTREALKGIGDGARDEETLRRLKALGYTD